MFDEVRLVEGGDTVPPEERHASYLGQVATLGRRTAELHTAFASDTNDPHFQPEPVTAADLEGWTGGAKMLAQSAFDQLDKARSRAPEALQGPIKTLLERKEECVAALDRLGKARINASKTRIHGDYHLGQVLVAKNDFYIIDFE